MLPQPQGQIDAVGLNDALDMRQVLGQSACFALLAWGCPVRIGCTGRDFILVGGDLHLCLSDGGFEILPRQFQQRGAVLFRFRTKLRMLVVSDLTLKRRNQLFQFGDEGVLLGHRSLFVLACRTLDRASSRAASSAADCAAKVFITSGGRSGNGLISGGYEMRILSRSG